MTGNPGGVLNQLYALVGVAIFIAIGGDTWVIQGLARTYEAVPLLSAPEIGSLVEGAQVAFSGIFGAAMQICAPVLLAVVLTDAAFGVVSRVVPQLNVFAVGFPAKVAVGLRRDRRLAPVPRRLARRRAAEVGRLRPPAP